MQLRGMVVLGLTAALAIAVAGSTVSESTLVKGGPELAGPGEAMVTATARASAGPRSSATAVEDPTRAAPTSDVTNLEPLPPCATGDVTTPLARLVDWNLTLVDTMYALPSSYAPDDLVGTDVVNLSADLQVRSIILSDLRALLVAAANAYAKLDIVSGYRSYSTQVWVFNGWVAALGYPYASVTSARAGHSEHQLGVAIDFEGYGDQLPWLYADFATQTRAGRWLAANAWHYGFIMSYPRRGSPSKTCYRYEPWHYRYVGLAEAATVHASGLTLREWLWRHQPNPEPPSPMETPEPRPASTPGAVGPPGDLAP